jgi:hypothetical protein
MIKNDPRWRERSRDRCPTYRLCQECCSSGPMGMHCQLCKTDRILYFCMQTKVKNNKDEEITRLIDDQWMLRVMELMHIDALANRVQEDRGWPLSATVNMEWLKTRVIWKYYEDLREIKYCLATNKEIKEIAGNGWRVGSNRDYYLRLTAKNLTLR